MDGTTIATFDPISGLDPPFGGAQEGLTTNAATGAGSQAGRLSPYSMCTQIASLWREKERMMQLCFAVQGAGWCRLLGQVSRDIKLHVDSASPSRAATHPGSGRAIGRLDGVWTDA